MRHVCYVDEAGCPGALPSATANIQPALIIAGIALPLSKLRDVTTGFLDLKRRYYPTSKGKRSLDCVRYEIKGSDVRKNIATGNQAEQRHAIGFLDKVIGLLEKSEARTFGRIWVKGIAQPFDGNAVYTYSIQAICETFQHMLGTAEGNGVVIADSRNKPANSSVSHSIFTQKFRAAGDPFHRVVEMPTFGHSDNHVGLQISDLLTSAILFPMTMQAFCTGHVNNIHVRPGYNAIAQRYAANVKGLQYRYQDRVGRWRGGLTVSDAIAQRGAQELFR